MRAPDHIVHAHAHGEAPSRRVRHALGRARLCPPALSPSAVLAVRRLGDPLPGTVGAGLRVPPRWERAAREALDDTRHRAVRPRGGRVPETADAVLFADEAEWRACAALAFARSTRPWWADSLTVRSVPRLFAEAPHLLPALLDHLTTWDAAALVLGAVSAPEADVLVERACEAAGVAVPRAVSLDPISPRIGDEIVPPWSASGSLVRAVDAVDTWVGRAQATLLGVAGTLARGPHRLRHAETAAAVARWRAAPKGHGGPAEETTPNPATSNPPPQRPQGESPSPIMPTEAATPPAPKAVLDEVAAPGTASPERSGPAPEVDLWTDGTATRLGGVFFLLPVMRAFGWPASAEDPWRLASTTGTWGALEALARGLLGDRLGDDPLWRLLAHLDGREPDTMPRDAETPKSADLTAPVPGLPPALAAWTRTVLPEVEARLVDALALDGPASVPEVVLLRDAAVHTTRSHVDVVFPLASAGLAVRRAGLDADPGWVPSAGRVVLFHYR